MYDFVCEHIVPGCTHKDSDAIEADLVERAAAHIREHHDLDHREEPVAQVLARTGAVFIRPA